MGIAYCPECNETIAGNYCPECGTKSITKNENDSPAADSWREEKDFRKLVKNPEVQAYLIRFSGKSERALSAKEFLKRIDQVFAPTTGISLEKLMDVMVPVYKKIGIKTGKSRTDTFDYTIQEVLLKVLCSLVKRNLSLQSVHEANNGVVLVAEIPSSMKTFGGELVVSLEEGPEKTKVTAAAQIKGQLFDWGESKSKVKAVFSDIEEIEIDF
ncbi:hypothetical protein FGM00_09785 [Aggregatimonas sangjinii]|uniref:Uncharacterized protein n=1 Tax=Aggregatimonas sangjinii TaxID=2583587 RepID=A0A5B7STQ8_9FLAO|nr:hypothetical protein [Aggregatimonas sangjinii]QCX00388.1 hypothetical protein FGM00_09785 [Aggregatimonas sangjinii]